MLRQPEPCKSLYPPRSSIASDKETKAPSNKRTTVGCSCSGTGGSVTKPQRENIDGGPPGGAGAEGPGAPTIDVKTSMAGPREAPELKIRDRTPSTWKRRWRAPEGAGDEGPGAPTIDVKMSLVGPRELGGARAEGSRVPTINVKTSTAGP
jgi:hypothetical protein